MISLQAIHEIQEENRVLKETVSLFQKQLEQARAAYDSIYHQLQELKRFRFGKKSERFVDDAQQGSLFGEPFPDLSREDAEEKEETIRIPEHMRKKNKSGKDTIPDRIEIIQLPENEKICPCGACRQVIRYESRKIINFQPAVVEIIEQRREVAACEKGCDGSIRTAPAPLHVLPKVCASEEMLAFLITSKVEDRQPLYHLEKQLAGRHGIDISRQTMARWMIDLMIPLRPLVNLMKEEIIGYDVSSCDATTLQVLDEPGRPAETKSYAYCMRGGPPDRQVVLYEYNCEGHKKFVKDWYEGFSGYLHVDGDNFFELVGALDNVSLVNCNAHARRKFEPIAKSSKRQGVAKEALRFYKAIYQVERKAKNEGMTPEQRHQLRQEHSKPILDRFIEWLTDIRSTVLPKSPLGGAVDYFLNRKGGLTRYLEDGRLEADNNGTEQKIKPFVVARKNFLFAHSQEGAKALCVHFGLVQTARLHGLDPYRYYVCVLKKIPHCKTVEDYEKLLPWNIRKHYPEML